MQNSAKNIARKIAKQIAQEPLEVLKSAREQVSGDGKPTPAETPQGAENSSDQNKLLGHQRELQDKMKSGRRMEALNRELEDIHKQGLFSDLQRRITEGEEVPLEDYPELSLEQKQVLKAQMEAVRVQRVKAEYTNDQLVEPTPKKSRRFGPSRKQEAMRQQTRVEKPVPPSG